MTFNSGAECRRYYSRLLSELRKDQNLNEVSMSNCFCWTLLRSQFEQGSNTGSWCLTV